MDFQEAKEHLDLFLRDTNFETEFSYMYVENDPFNKDTLDGVSIWRKGESPRILVTTIRDLERLDMIEEFMLTFLKMSLRQEDIFQLYDKHKYDYLEKERDIELSSENNPTVSSEDYDPFLYSEELP